MQASVSSVINPKNEKEERFHVLCNTLACIRWATLLFCTTPSENPSKMTKHDT